MMRRILAAFVTLALGAASLPAAANVSDPDVAKGIRLVEEGDYDAAIFILDGAARRMLAEPSAADLPQAFLYLGIAYVAKGHVSAAKIKFREALARVGDLSLSPDRFPPKIIDVFEEARADMSKTSRSAGKGGKGKTVLLVGGVLAAGAGVAVAASGSNGKSETHGATVAIFPGERMAFFGGERTYDISARHAGTLTALVEWQTDGLLLGMDAANLADPGRVLAQSGRTAAKQATLTLRVAEGDYRVTVRNTTGSNCPCVDNIYTLTLRVDF
jgi:hypothetical protein